MSNTASEATQPTCPEMGQMVCGRCRRLLSYPQGAKHVQCLRCKTVNIVLDANQVGHVKCGSCLVLLMYPYGAPSVRCSSCHFVTEIGVTNVLYQYNSNLAPGTKLGFLAAKLAFKEKRLVKAGGPLVNNLRPPLSAQQGQPPPPQHPVH